MAPGRCWPPRHWKRPPVSSSPPVTAIRHGAAFIRRRVRPTPPWAPPCRWRPPAGRLPCPRHPPGPARPSTGKARSGWASLTPAETTVAALVDEGLSQHPEIAAKLLLSRRTVATHVSHILRKLGVHSRTEIAREAALRTTTPRSDLTASGARVTGGQRKGPGREDVLVHGVAQDGGLGKYHPASLLAGQRSWKPGMQTVSGRSIIAGQAYSPSFRSASPLTEQARPIRPCAW